MNWSKLRGAIIAGSFLLLSVAGAPAEADVLGMYAGGAIGRGQVDQNVFGYTSAGRRAVGGFDEETSYQGMFGIRPIPYLGVELGYVAFGKAARDYSDGIGYAHYTLKLKGPEAAVLGYVPIGPIDLFARAGVARLFQHYELEGGCLPQVLCFVGPQKFTGTERSTGFVGGIGAQFHIGPIALRAEYERFTVTDGHPRLALIGGIWTF